jgi:hypothetical protein
VIDRANNSLRIETRRLRKRIDVLAPLDAVASARVVDAPAPDGTSRPKVVLDLKDGTMEEVDRFYSVRSARRAAEAINRYCAAKSSTLSTV